VTVTAGASPLSSSSSHGLSVGAQAGIGVAVGLAGLGLIIFGALALLRRRRHGRRLQDDSHVHDKPELSGDSVSDERRGLAEADTSHGVAEADGVGRPPEMDDRNVRAELEGDWRGHEAPT